MDDARPLINRRYKSFCQILSICINACLSSIFIGYSLVYLGTLPNFQFIIDEYSIGSHDTQKITQSLVQGCVPIGAIFGALSCAQLLKRLSRKNCFLVTNIVGVISLSLFFIHSPVTLVLGRLLQGLCTGVYSTIVPLYINEIVTPDLTNLGTLNQVFISSSQAFSFLLYYILAQITDNESVIWIWVSQFLLITIIVQSFIFLFVFPYQTPKYLFQKGKFDSASSLIHRLYHSDYVEEAISQFRTGTNRSMLEGPDSIGVHEDFHESGNRLFVTSKIAIFFAVYLATLQQLSGVNAIVVYGKEALQPILSKQLNNILPIFISVMPAITAGLATILMKKLGRKVLIQMGTLVSTICLLLMFFGFQIQQNSKDTAAILISIGMIVFMAFFGLTLGPIVWLYIPEIVEPKIIPFSTMANLAGATICIMIFPLIKDALPNENPSYLFLIFLIWCFVALFVNCKFMVETKGKSRETIFKEYKELKTC